MGVGQIFAARFHPRRGTRYRTMWSKLLIGDGLRAYDVVYSELF